MPAPPQTRDTGAWPARSLLGPVRHVAALSLGGALELRGHEVPEGGGEAGANVGSIHELGRWGEALAVRYFEERGWAILDRNWRSGHAEVDLVVRRGAVVAFVEVKTRVAERSGHPLESITLAKRREIERVARAWLTTRGGDLAARCAFRFDAVAVTTPRGRPAKVCHVPDAWRIGDSG